MMPISRISGSSPLFCPHHGIPDKRPNAATSNSFWRHLLCLLLLRVRNLTLRAESVITSTTIFAGVCQVFGPEACSSSSSYYHYSSSNSTTFTIQRPKLQHAMAQTKRFAKAGLRHLKCHESFKFSSYTL